MRITQEADYAIRVMIYLHKNNNLTDAKTISDGIKVPIRYTLKILRKLVHGKLIESRKGIHGGYRTSLPKSEVSLADIIELIDGEIRIARCFSNEYSCTKNGSMKDNCAVHNAFADVNEQIYNQLKSYTLDKFC